MELAIQENLTPAPGRIHGLIGAPGSGLTRLGLSMLAGYVSPVAYVDVRGWLCPPAAWEMGVDQLVVVRCSDHEHWPNVVGALIDGMTAVYAEVPPEVRPSVLRRVAALTRKRRTSVVLRPLRGELPGGVTFTRVEALDVTWKGVEVGHGRLQARRMSLLVSGKGSPPHHMEIEDDGSNTLRVVSRLATTSVGRAVG